ncbi:LADA_0G10000g1_1 [Lachancea dasiensis]|uniref:LADA_0G10000g1_1 n=1 Tax=Lachancea dasiensis TaxID=1072105 RepID=A0A1G4JUY8_9SACH|nr:LADA_0G10000g1_1 [Lachancea dasiensis]
MRDSNHRCISLNRSSVTITSTVYDRRGLNCTSEIPLINSLNHLTYLTSNSAKVRETLATDGALIRLVSILHDCHVSLDEWPALEIKNDLNIVQQVERERKLAMIAWKWTLAFQCLVLTGTRGTEQIRKQVVSSGVIPILATVLDNYLLIEKGHDFIKDKPLRFDFKNSQFDQDCDLSSEIDLEGILLRYKRLATPEIMQLNTSFSELWESTMNNLESGKECDTYENIAVPIPRTFFWGKIVPKADDVIWSLQLLAFISKYTHLKPHLQNVQLVKTLSLRGALSIAEKRYEPAFGISGLEISSKNEKMPELKPPSNVNTDETPIDFTDPLLIDMQSHCKKLGQVITFHSANSAPKNCNQNRHGIDKRSEMYHLKQEFEHKWNYATYPKILDDQSFQHIKHAPTLNLFPLVERFTVKKENEKDMTYWSSVIMRNSCRKNENTGVRQCANFACGKWEDFPKRFAKCRRCKKTKYCSRECQLHSWNYHRYWCQEVSSSAGQVAGATIGEGTTSNQPQSATDSITESATAETPNVDNDRALLTTSDDNTGMSHRMEHGPTLQDRT